MRDIQAMTDKWKLKMTAYLGDNYLAGEIETMGARYQASQQSLRDKQMIAKGVMIENTIPPTRQASLLMWANLIWRLVNRSGLSGEVLTQTLESAIAYYTVVFAWVAGEVDCANAIADGIIGSMYRAV
jgi:hypothetical protein